MVYNLGASGLGHWVRRLQATLDDKGREIVLYKAVGTRSYAERKDELVRYGIPNERYYPLEPGSPLPDDFFKDLDIVYVASPNKFHKDQTLQALERDKVTVTEKTLATSRMDFEDVVTKIRMKKAESKVTIGLHYISKALTKEFGRMLPDLVKKYGLITRVSGTFFEETRDEDAKRTWLFKPENGGIAMDWIHPISIVSYTMGATRMTLKQARSYLVQPLYDEVYPTGFHVTYELVGEFFAESSLADIRVSKGLEVAHKKLRVIFQRATVDLNYISTDEEFDTGLRGEIVISSSEDKRVISPSGPLSYEPMIDDMLRMVKGGSPTLSLDDIVKIYDPEWQLQEEINRIRPLRDKGSINQFIKEGLSHHTG
jgi:predicted dehydrogenase